MLKGQLSRVHWPGNLWMPFTFQSSLTNIHTHCS